MKNNHDHGHTQQAKRAARRAGLRYLDDAVPGIRRHQHGRGFTYVNSRGKPVRDSKTLGRIHSLAIPPAWTDVWIAAAENGHLQATGHDAKGRKQYRYHPDWRKRRDANKYEHLEVFAKALPKIRRRVARDLKRRGLPREKVLAAVVRLLEITLIRVGNDEYARDNHSFGLTTMKDRHAKVRGKCIRFHFRGKSGKDHEIDLQSPALARVVRQCQELPGQELFQYVDEDGKICDIESADVNEYLHKISGSDVTAKDFRTWAGTVLAAQALQEFEGFDSAARAKRNVTRAIESVAAQLGNTTAICRKCYVHPAVIEAYMDRTLLKRLRSRIETTMRSGLRRLKPQEAAVVALLQERMKRDLGGETKVRA